MRLHECRYRVIYRDIDKMNAVYYANYLSFFEIGRSEFLRTLGFPYSALEEKGFIMPVVDLHCQYVSPARYDEEIIIRTVVFNLSRVRIGFRHEIVSAADKRLIARGEVILACLGTNGKIARIPQELVEVIELDETTFKI